MNKQERSFRGMRSPGMWVLTRSQLAFAVPTNERQNARVLGRETWWPQRTPGMTAEFDAVNCLHKASFSAGSRLIHLVREGTESTNKVAYGPPALRDRMAWSSAISRSQRKKCAWQP